MRLSMSLRPMVFLAQNCTECGRPLSKPEEALGPEEEQQVRCAVDKGHEPANYKRCPKCGKAVIDDGPAETP